MGLEPGLQRYEMDLRIARLLGNSIVVCNSFALKRKKNLVGGEEQNCGDEVV